MRSYSTPKLTTAMLTQLQQNEYLRVKLIQLQQICREKDNFYMSIFREQEQVTEKVMAQLVLAEEKIKQLIRERICNNWQQQYDVLANSITSYVKDVNELIQKYQQTRQKLQEKALKNNDLYQYYSNTLQECGKKFDQAQMIIEQLNDKISDLKQTVVDLDEDLGQKDRIILEQTQQIQNLHYQLHGLRQIEELQRVHQQDLRIIDDLKITNEEATKTIQALKKASKRSDKEKQGFQRSIKQMEKIVKELKNEVEEYKNQKKVDFSQIQTLSTQITKLQTEIKDLNTDLQVANGKLAEKQEQAQELRTNLRLTQKQLSTKSQELKKMSQTYPKPQIKKEQVEFISMFDKSDNPAIKQAKGKFIYDFNQHQLHLKKIIQQEETIKHLNHQLIYYQKLIETLELQNQKLVQIQMQLISKETHSKNEIQQLRNSYDQKFRDLKNKRQFEISQKEEQLTRKTLELERLQNQFHQLKQQNSGLNEEIEKLNGQIGSLHKQKTSLKNNFENLLEQFQVFVKQSEAQKQNQIIQKKLSLSLSSFQINECYFNEQILNSNNFSQMKKKILYIDIDESPENENKIKQVQNQRPQLNTTIRTKKFNLQNLQQKANPHLNFCCSPKVGQIFNAVHQGRKNAAGRW